MYRFLRGNDTFKRYVGQIVIAEKFIKLTILWPLLSFTLTPSLKIAPTDSISPITKMACNKLCLGQFLSQGSNNFKLALNGFFSLNKCFENIYSGLSKAANRRYLYFLPYSYTRKARYQSPATPRTQIYSLIIWKLVINTVLSDSKELWKRNRNVRIWVCSSFNIKKGAKKRFRFFSLHFQFKSRGVSGV